MTWSTADRKYRPVDPSASLTVSAGIGAIAVTMAGVFVALVTRARPDGGRPDRSRGRRLVLAATGTAAWMGLTASLAVAGVLRLFDARPPPLGLMMVAIVVGSIGLGLSPVGRRVAAGTPLALLVAVQAFRLPLELVMHQAAAEAVMPPQLTFGVGFNYDIATGATAIVVATLAHVGKAPRALLVAWNVLGLAMLAIILVVAIGTAPFVRAFGDDPRNVNTWVAHFPFVWLPAVLVSFALFGHVVVARRLLART